MQYFRDTQTGRHWALGDEVRVEESEEGLIFFDDIGMQVADMPLTLERVGSLPEPPAPVPMVVSRFQGREAMWQTPHGDTTLFEAAEAVLADPATPAMYRRAWDDLQEFRRDSEMLAAIAGMLGLTAAQIDALFILAASIQA
ncbi:hypothetical protein [Achromobacter kerstersii]